MQDPVEHGGGEHGVARERLVPTAECEIGGEDQRASFVTPRDHLEEQIGLLASERQIADLVDDQQLRCRDHAMHRLFHPALPISRFHRDDEIGSRREAYLPTLLRRNQSERDREVRLAGAARTEQDDILGALDKA